jgi:aerobic carbon-monoxide dehydrogenase medium subunit
MIGLMRNVAKEAWARTKTSAAIVRADGMSSDIHGSAEYRAHLIGVLARRAVAAAGGYGTLRARPVTSRT